MKKLLVAFVLFASAIVAAQISTGTITGQLLTREGQPAAGIRVSAMAVPEPGVPVNNATALVSIGQTDTAGRYRLDNIPAGRYYVVAGFVDLPTYYPGVSSLNGATPVSVLSGTPVTGINFTMVVPAGVTLSGRVLSTAGGPLPQAQRIALRGTSGVQSPARDVAVNADGTFEFTRVRPGNYLLMVSSGTLAQPVSIVVGENDVRGIDVRIAPVFNVTGTVTVEGNGVRPRFTITFSPFRGGVTNPSATMATNGTFRTTLQESDYQIGWSGLPAGYQVKSIKAGTADLLTGPLKLSGSSAAPNIEVLLGVDAKPPWVKVSGRISGLSGVPNTNALRIGMTGGLSVDALEVPVNPDGSFQFDRVLPGAYTAVLTPRLPIPATPIFVPSQDVANLTITVPPLKEVRGDVTTQGSNFRPNSISFAWNDTPGTPTTSANVSLSVPVKADGTFSVLMPLGDRRVTVSSAGYSVQSATFGAADLLREPLKLSAASVEEIRVTIAPTLTRTVVGGVVGGVAGGVLGGIVTGIVGGVGGAPPPPPPPPPPTSIQRIGGDVAQANLVSSVPPVYPPLARAARVQGVVLLQVQISKDGAVEDIRVISGHPLLNEAAIEAVRQWRYKPQPGPVVTTVTVNFSSP